MGGSNLWPHGAGAPPLHYSLFGWSSLAGLELGWISQPPSPQQYRPATPANSNRLSLLFQIETKKNGANNGHYSTGTSIHYFIHVTMNNLRRLKFKCIRATVHQLQWISERQTSWQVKQFRSARGHESDEPLHSTVRKWVWGIKQFNRGHQNNLLLSIIMNKRKLRTRPWL